MKASFANQCRSCGRSFVKTKKEKEFVCAGHIWFVLQLLEQIMGATMLVKNICARERTEKISQ